jgi:hypothetical protein
MPFVFKVHKHGNDTFLAFADSELIGKTLKHGDHAVSVSAEFYGGDEADEKAIEELLKSATVINAIGKRAVGLLISEGLVKENETVKVDGVPHAQIFVMP